jgi:hypothetical protein
VEPKRPRTAESTRVQHVASRLTLAKPSLAIRYRERCQPQLDLPANGQCEVLLIAFGIDWSAASSPSAAVCNAVLLAR